MNLKLTAALILLVNLLPFSVIMNNSKAIELAPNLHKTTLGNGLNLLVKETPGTHVATVQIWVKTGSVYETENEGGITHLIEHMIFKGTPTRGAGELAAIIEEAGGSINAYTYYEYTVYHATLSSRQWPLALDVLADAVLHSTFDPEELEREKKVVLEEIAMREDRPQLKLYQEMMSRSYTVHPYRLPIIGTRESVSSFTRDDILRYVKKHYTPQNLTVVVVGDVRFNQVAGQTRRLFGELPRLESSQPSLPAEPAREDSRFFTLNEDILQSHLSMSFPITPFNHPDSPVLDVIATLLGQGETSRLYNQLRNRKGLVYRISADAFTPRDPGLFEVSATLEPQKSREVIAAALEEIFKLKYVPVSEEELSRVKRNLESDFIFGLERVEGQARIIGSFEFLAGDPREEEYLNQIRSVSPDDILRVAKTYFTGKGLTVGLILPKEVANNLDQGELAQIITSADNMAHHGLPSSLVENTFLPGVHKFKFHNGLTLLVREDQRVETVAIRAVLPGGLRSEDETTNGAFAFISQLLPKGTQDLSYRELAIKVADMAGIISGFSGKNTFGLKGDFLARFMEPGMGLIHDILMKPAFSQEEADKIRPELLARLRQQADSMPTVAFQKFNAALFQGHPYGLNPIGDETAINNFTVEQLKRIYQGHLSPEKLVLSVAGAVKAEEVRDLVENLFADWPAPPEKPSDITEESSLPPDPPSHPIMVKEVREREQLHIVIGFLGTTLTDPDRHRLEILDTVLGGQSGRLFTELRDKQSMAYSLSPFSLMGVDTGSFGIYIGTSPDKKEAVIEAAWQELFKIRQELISEAELSKAKKLLIGQYELGLQTHGAQALEMALNETYGLGLDQGSRFIEEISNITAEQVLETAQKYILPNHYVMVTLGAAPPPQATPAPEGAEDQAVSAPPAVHEGGEPAGEKSVKDTPPQTEESAPAAASDQQATEPAPNNAPEDQ